MLTVGMMCLASLAGSALVAIFVTLIVIFVSGYLYGT